MIQSNRSYNLVTIGILLLLAFVLQFTCQDVLAATGNVTKVRCHMYEEGGKPVKVRVAIDFDGSPIKVNLVKSDDPYGEAPKGFIEDFIIVAASGADNDAIGKATISAGNTKGKLNVITESGKIRIAIIEGYELQSAKFSYLETVAYSDMKVITRTVKPEPKKEPKLKAVPKPKPKPKVVPVPIAAPVPVPTPKVAAKKVKPKAKPTLKTGTDTVYIDKIIHDTIYVEKIVYIVKGEIPNRLFRITAGYFDTWWNDPYFRLEFKFSKKAENLELSPIKRKLSNIPKGYEPVYAIIQQDKDAPVIFNDVYVNYARTSGKILLLQRNNKCYILAKDGYSVKATKLQYDNFNHIVSLRLQQ
ncbi:MAG: hypothetical protein HQ568_03810 [Calditrichaeota bacterium]|nr:hypothetical protein [Calditrichota bacterium]